ncbi:MAG: hypothetical protein OER88_11645, partial [Planctomycetota bacterium]|nr:hypothetical protein [Planctomycetota bacterium]
AAEALGAFKDPRCVGALTQLRKEAGFEYVAAYGLLRVADDKSALTTLRNGLAGGAEPDLIFHLLEKCGQAGVGDLLVQGLREAPEDTRIRILELLKRRYWKTTRERVKAILIKQLDSAAVHDYVLETVTEFSDPEIARKLEGLVKSANPKRWPALARAFARTGDPAAVRYFGRMRVLAKRRDERRLARDLHDEASRNQAARAKSDKSNARG